MHDFYDFRDLKIGMRVNVEGEYDGDSGIRARTISIRQDGDRDEIEATVQSVDTGAGTLRLLGLTLHLGDGVEIKDLDKNTAALGSLRQGTRIKTKGRLGDGRRFEPEKIKVKSNPPDAQDEIEGKISALDATQRTLQVLGFEIVCREDVEIEA